jgi:hypothetical protein
MRALGWLIRSLNIIIEKSGRSPVRMACSRRFDAGNYVLAPEIGCTYHVTPFPGFSSSLFSRIPSYRRGKRASLFPLDHGGNLSGRGVSRPCSLPGYCGRRLRPTFSESPARDSDPACEFRAKLSFASSTTTDCSAFGSRRSIMIWESDRILIATSAFAASVIAINASAVSGGAAALSGRPLVVADRRAARGTSAGSVRIFWELSGYLIIPSLFLSRVRARRIPPHLGAS